MNGGWLLSDSVSASVDMVMIFLLPPAGVLH